MQHGAATSATCAVELPRNLPSDTLPRHKITVTLGNSRISKRSLCDGPVFIVCQKSETLNQTNSLLQ